MRRIGWRRWYRPCTHGLSAPANCRHDHPNPARGITRYREQGRERFLTTDELARLGDALHEGETTGWPYLIDETKPTSKFAQKDRMVKLDPFAAAAIRLLVLTGARLREVLHAKWSELDLERGVCSLADSKTGRKPIYLGAAALAVIASLPRLHGNPHLIPGSIEGKPRVSLDAPWAAVTKAAGLKGLRIHDLRHRSQASERAAAWDFRSLASCSAMRPRRRRRGMRTWTVTRCCVLRSGSERRSRER